MLVHVSEGRTRIEEALDAERRALMRSNESCLEAYLTAAQRLAADWPAIQEQLGGLPLVESHRILIERARELLPSRVQQADS